jgi:hypoxanthine phosphoribosyltransferase
MGPTSVAPDEILNLKPMSKKQHYSWDHFHTLVGEIKKKVQTTPNIIVSIGKGGSIPGVILAEMFECNNLNLGLKSYKGETRGEIHEYQGIKCFDSLRDANILVVDDIADSGETLKYAVSKLKENGCESIQTASVFYKPCSRFKPDYFAEEVDEKVWIVQPWEPMEVL